MKRRKNVDGEIDFVEISNRASTKIKKAFFAFFDWLLPDYRWGGGGSYL